jgi:hypothetical protein
MRGRGENTTERNAPSGSSQQSVSPLSKRPKAGKSRTGGHNRASKEINELSVSSSAPTAEQRRRAQRITTKERRRKLRQRREKMYKALPRSYVITDGLVPQATRTIRVWAVGQPRSHTAAANPAREVQRRKLRSHGRVRSVVCTSWTAQTANISSMQV